jgi:PAS domain S-box-containing protein
MAARGTGGTEGDAASLNDLLAATLTRDQPLLAGDLWQNATVGVAVYDADGCYLDVNPAFCELTGYTRDEMLAKRAGDLMPNPSTRKLVPYLLSRTHRRGGLTATSGMRRKDGTLTRTSFRLFRSRLGEIPVTVVVVWGADD